MGKLKTGLVANGVGAVFPIAIALVTVPLYIRFMGMERFGVISLMWLMIGYFGLLDFGLSRATVFKLSREIDAKRDLVFWTSAWASLIVGVVIFSIFITSAHAMIVPFLNLNHDVRDEFELILPWIAIGASIVSMNAIFTGKLEVEGKFVTVNVIQICGILASQVFPIFIMQYFQPTLFVVIPTMIIVRLATLVITAGCAWSTLHSRRVLPPNPQHARELGRFGGWVTVSSVISPIMTSLDQFLIASKLGVGSVPYYSVPYSLATRLSVIPTALIRTIFPTMSAEHSRIGTSGEGRYILPLSFVMTSVCSVGIIVFPIFLSYWIGQEFSSTSAICGQVLMVGMWFNCLAYLPVAKLNATGKPEIVAKIHCVEIVPFILILTLLLHYFGIVGAAIAWTIRVAIDCVFLNVASRSWTSFWRTSLPGAFIVAFAFCAAYTPPTPLFMILALIAVSVFATCWLLFSSKSLRSFAGQKIRRNIR